MPACTIKFFDLPILFGNIGTVLLVTTFTCRKSLSPFDVG